MEVDVQLALDQAGQASVPNAHTIQCWVDAALQVAEQKTTATQMTVRIVERDEIVELNEQFRQKNGPTNVLSFPFEPTPGMPAELAEPELGDVVVCAAVVEQEAREQNKTSEAHWAHMIVHGSLHLLGYDHIKEDEAKQMEALEVDVLARLGFADPYS